MKASVCPDIFFFKRVALTEKIIFVKKFDSVELDTMINHCFGIKELDRTFRSKKPTRSTQSLVYASKFQSKNCLKA